MKDRIFTEITICFIFSGIPIFLIYLFDGEDKLLDFVKSLSPLRDYLWYLAFISVSSWCLLLVKRFIYLRHDSSRALWSKLEVILSELANAFFGLLRTTSGVLLFLPMLLVIEDFDKSYLPNMISNVLTGIAGLVECIYFSSLLDYKTRGNSLSQNDLRL